MAEMSGQGSEIEQQLLETNPIVEVPPRRHIRTIQAVTSSHPSPISSIIHRPVTRGHAMPSLPRLPHVVFKQPSTRHVIMRVRV